MDDKGMERINEAVARLGYVKNSVRPEPGRHVRFFSIVSQDQESTFYGRPDPSHINKALDAAGMMYHEGHGFTAATASPLLKYLGSNGCYHAYEDVVSE